LAFCRELAPLLTAGILAGQVGSAFAAELGSMRVTEQIDALKMLRTNPIDYLVIPRVIACCLMLPVLNIFSLVTGIVGGGVVGVLFYGVRPAIFLASVHLFLGTSDLINVVLKGFIFGAVIAVISCSWGLTTTGGVKGVGRSATGAVVTSWVSIFAVDFFLSWALFQELGIAV
ncbi:MAG: ABC transporter permease, partial [Symploca sp. SIO1C4]|nr:ABC transporter permease [Symploca sp. SIO1C4]